MKLHFTVLILFLLTALSVHSQYSNAFKEAEKEQMLHWLKYEKNNDVRGLVKVLKTPISSEINLGLSAKEKELLVSLKDFYFVKSLAQSIQSKDTIDETSKYALQELPVLPMNGELVKYSLNSKSLGLVYDDYFFLQMLNQGLSIDQAKSSGSANTGMTSEFNESYYKRIIYYLSKGDEVLKNAYLNKLQSVFRYNGYTSGLTQVLPYVYNEIKDGKEKDKILSLYRNYDHLQIGKIAPYFKLPDDRGHIVSLNDFRGKVVVIDVWATWCTWCIQKLPHYLALKDKYKNRNDIVFLSISIDDTANKYEWMYTIPNIGLLGFVNLWATASQSSFTKDYLITGIPRYMVIDKEGKIVNLYVPGADSETMTKAIAHCLE